MFTGIVEELGRLERIDRGTDSAVLHLYGPTVTSDATPGASIAVNGVCLTPCQIEYSSRIGYTF